jgi:hypothetical protein
LFLHRLASSPINFIGFLFLHQQQARQSSNVSSLEEDWKLNGENLVGIGGEMATADCHHTMVASLIYVNTVKLP